MTEKKKRNIRCAALVKFVTMLFMSILLLGGLLLCEKETLSAKDETTELTLTKRKETDSTAFQVNNLLPGDIETKDYCVKVACEDTAIVYFRVDIKKGYEKLAEVLKCRVVLTDTGETLYDGLMKNLSETVSRGMPTEVKDGDELLYQITAYLDTSVGNEYQNTSLKADFVWWLEAEEHTATDTEDNSEDTLASGQEGDRVTSGADAGDDAKPLLWISLGACAALILVFLLVQRRKGEARHE